MSQAFSHPQQNEPHNSKSSDVRARRVQRKAKEARKDFGGARDAIADTWQRVLKAGIGISTDERTRRAALNLLEDAELARRGEEEQAAERKRAEEALQEGRQRLEALVKNLPGGAVFIVGPDLRYQLAAGEALAGAGLTPEHFLGRTVAEAVGAELAVLYEPRYRQALAGETFTHEHDSYGNSYLTRGVPLRDAGGAVTAVLAVSFDITARHRAENALQGALQEAEQARAEAEAANAAKDHFLAVLSHELRTPLMPITMALAVLGRRTDVPQAVHQVHEMIARNVELEARFINDLLDVTRVARGKMEIVRKEMDLHEAIERAVEVSTPDTEAKGQRVSMLLAAAERTLSGDFARLQQVFWNLLKNASKFTPPGGAIDIRSRNEAGNIVVEITDTGLGMEAEAVERIFHPFEQANISITREFGGLGLGLAIAKASVEAHGGALRASSPGLNQGATFIVSLPLEAVDGGAVPGGN